MWCLANDITVLYRSHKQDSRNPSVDYFQYHVNCLPYIYYTYVVLNIFLHEPIIRLSA